VPGEVILLVIFFSIGEFGDRDNLSFDIADGYSESLSFFDTRILSDFLLPLVLIENSIHVLSAAVTEFAAMRFPEVAEQLVVTDDCGIVVDRDGFRVIGEGVVIWLFFAATTISNTGAQYTFETPKLGIRTPESSHTEGCRFVSHLGCFKIKG